MPLFCTLLVHATVLFTLSASAAAGPLRRVSNASLSCPDVVVGVYYVGSESASRLPPEELDPALFTHGFYAFATIDPRSYFVTSSNNKTDPALMKRFTSVITARNPCARPMISIGGAGSSNVVWSAMVSTPDSRTAFINSAIAFARFYGFAGVDLDWEFPSTAQDSQNLITFLQQFQLALTGEAKVTGNQRLQISIALPAGTSILAAGYDLPRLHGLVDFINVLTYDYNGAWGSVTGPNAPLYTDGVFSVESINSTIDYLHSHGVPFNKLVMGIAGYGYAWRVLAANQTKPGQPVWIKYRQLGNSSQALVGPVSRHAGQLYYNEIAAMCFRLHSAENKTSSFVLWGGGCGKAKGDSIGDLYLDNFTATAYGIIAGTWFSFDTVHTITRKLQYAVDQQFAGAFLWTASNDVPEHLGSSEPSLLSLMTDTLLPPGDIPSPSPSPTVSPGPFPFIAQVSLHFTAVASELLVYPRLQSLTTAAVATSVAVNDQCQLLSLVTKDASLNTVGSEYSATLSCNCSTGQYGAVNGGIDATQLVSEFRLQWLTDQTLYSFAFAGVQASVTVTQADWLVPAPDASSNGLSSTAMIALYAIAGAGFVAVAVIAAGAIKIGWSRLRLRRRVSQVSGHVKIVPVSPQGQAVITHRHHNVTVAVVPHPPQSPRSPRNRSHSPRQHGRGSERLHHQHSSVSTRPRYERQFV